VQAIEQSWTNVYVKDLDPEISDDEFKQLFEAYGKVNSPLIKRNEKGLSTGFGFVNFERHEEAKAAVEALNGKKVGNKTITCCRAMKRFERETKLKREWEQQKFNKYHGINLYVKHLEDDVDEEMLRREFAAFGEVKSCKISVDEKGISKGFGFVCFSTPDEAQKAIIGLNSKILQGQKKPLFVTLHESKEVRKQKLAHRHNLAMTKVRCQSFISFSFYLVAFRFVWFRLVFAFAGLLTVRTSVACSRCTLDLRDRRCSTRMAPDSPTHSKSSQCSSVDGLDRSSSNLFRHRTTWA
jgi:RNA recognition motif-containing protein